MKTRKKVFSVGSAIVLKRGERSRTIYCIAHAQYHQSQDLRNGGRRPTFLPHFDGHLLTFQDILECLTVYQYM